MTTLSATVRSQFGKGAARKARRSGQVPAVMYCPDHETVHLSFAPKDLVDIFRETQNRNTVLSIEVDGQTVPTLVKKVQRNPLTREILHVDLYRLSEARPVEVMVPLETTGRPVGAVLGGRVRLIRRDIKARCVYTKIPSSFVVDVTPMNIGDMVKASEIPAPEGVEVVIDNDFNVVTLYGKKVRDKK